MVCSLLSVSTMKADKIHAATRHKTQHIHKIEQIVAGQYFSKEYAINAKQAGTLSARINTKNLGCEFHVTLYGSNTKYYLGNKDLPTIDLKPNKNRDSSGELKTTHVMLADVYKVLIQCKGPAEANGTLTIDYDFHPSSCEDIDYRRINIDDTLDAAKSKDLDDKKFHTYMLSGFSEQKDLSDCFELYARKNTRLSFRTKTISVLNKAKCRVNIIRAKDNKTIASIQPKKQLTTRVPLLAPGYYYVQIDSPNGLKDNQQILYSIYMAKAANIKSVKLSKRAVTLYQLRGNQDATLAVQVNHQKKISNLVRFKSSNPSVASVSQSGKLTAKASGKATITCYAIDKPSVKATCKVTVKKPSLKVSVASRKIFIGNSTRCSLKRSPKKLKVTWKSSHPSVATVNAKGKVTGKSVGKAKIYAISKEGIKSNACTIIVHRKPKPKPKKPDDTTTEPGNKDDRTDKIAPVLSLSSAHLSPKGTITVTANVSGGTFSARGAISIKTKFGKSCVIRATAARGSGTILYQVNGKSASKSIVIY